MASAMGLQPPPAVAAATGGGGGAADPLSGLSRCLAGLCRPGACMHVCGMFAVTSLVH